MHSDNNLIDEIFDEIDRLESRVSGLTGCVLVMAIYQVAWLVLWAIGAL